MRKLNIGWKTITGAIAWALGVVSQPAVLDILPDGVSKVVIAVGGLLTAFGIRHAVAKVEQRQ